MRTVKSIEIKNDKGEMIGKITVTDDYPPNVIAQMDWPMTLVEAGERIKEAVALITR